MADCPYRALPDTAYWRRAVAGLPMEAVAPLRPTDLKITRKTKIATAGSCFAQHVSRYLAKSGFTYHVTERAPALVPDRVARHFSYGVFSARFGNVYTTRQLIQLFDRCYGSFHPVEPLWETEDGGFIDPFRPVIQPAPFVSEAELMADREAHFAATRAMFETLDVLVFTLGLTETYVHAEDGAAFPLCPGCGAGSFDPLQHVFLRMGVAEIEADLDGLVARLRGVNPSAAIILTVSPVPLIATMSGDHVLCATTYSKAVLRVAAETAVQRHANVHYFPSYEVVTGPHARGRYFASDLRSVPEDAVAHVMRLFFAMFAGETPAPPSAKSNPAAPPAPRETDLAEVACDEVILDQFARETAA